MKRESIPGSFCVVISLAVVAAFPQSRSPVVREQKKVMVAGTEERCRLEWRTPPSTECSPDDPDWSTCPCMGFAFGERGDLVLVRKKRGKAEERLALAPYFSGDFDRQGKNQEAVLRRWDVRAKDLEGQDSPDFVARVCARPIAGVMRLCDYNHDGQATEFIL